MARALVLTSALLGASACRGRPTETDGHALSAPAQAPTTESAPSSSVDVTAARATVAIPSGAASAEPDAPAAPPLLKERYAWLASAREFPEAKDTLESRFPAPPGYARVPVSSGSFAEWLRGLPLAPANTPVKRFDGTEVLPADDDYLAAVVAIDVGTQDLQQSSDVIVRLHAEWLWARGEHDAISYASATKQALPLSRWEKGQRLIADGANVFWAVKTKPTPITYDEFRRYLDAVFTWGNSSSLSVRARPVAEPRELSGGDFFLQTSAPGHVAVVLDIAEKPTGERVVLLGQGRNPAESVQVLRPGKATAWFSARAPNPVLSPHSGALPWSELRRLGGGPADARAAEGPAGERTEQVKPK